MGAIAAEAEAAAAVVEAVEAVAAVVEAVAAGLVGVAPAGAFRRYRQAGSFVPAWDPGGVHWVTGASTAAFVRTKASGLWK